MLSGGLNKDNISDAMRETGARGIDVSSGVESAPGVKDLNKMGRVFCRGRRRFDPRACIRERSVNESPKPNSFREGPDEDGRFGIFGGRFVAETLMPLILDLQGGMGKGQGPIPNSRLN